MEAMKVMQLGMQYLLFVQSKLLNATLAKEAHVLKHAEYVQRLQDKLHEGRLKMLKYYKLRQQLNEQAMHFEIMLNKMNPEILKERVKLISEDALADETSIFNRILREKGILSDYAMSGKVAASADDVRR